MPIFCEWKVLKEENKQSHWLVCHFQVVFLLKCVFAHEALILDKKRRVGGGVRGPPPTITATKERTKWETHFPILTQGWTSIGPERQRIKVMFLSNIKQPVPSVIKPENKPMSNHLWRDQGISFEFWTMGGITLIICVQGFWVFVMLSSVLPNVFTSKKHTYIPPFLRFEKTKEKNTVFNTWKSLRAWN